MWVFSGNQVVECFVDWLEFKEDFSLNNWRNFVKNWGHCLGNEEECIQKWFLWNLKYDLLALEEEVQMFDCSLNFGSFWKWTFINMQEVFENCWFFESNFLWLLLICSFSLYTFCEVQEEFSLRLDSSDWRVYESHWFDVNLSHYGLKKCWFLFLF